MNKKVKAIIWLGIIAILLLGGDKITKRRDDKLTTNGGFHYCSMTGTVKKVDLKANEIAVTIEDKLDEYKYDELTLIYAYNNLQKFSLNENDKIKFFFFSNEPKDKKEIHIDKIEVIKTKSK